jgi:hypothetical protein
MHGRLALFVAGAVALLGAAAGAEIVTFDGLSGGPWGSDYGTVSAELMLSEDQINLLARSFHIGEELYFVYTGLYPATAEFGSGQILRVSNMDVEFDFGTIAGSPGTVDLDFAHFGGLDNLMVNFHTMHQTTLSSLDGVEVAPGVMCWVSCESITGGVRCHLFLEGEVENIWIGGQEFYLDNIVFQPTTTDVARSTWGSIKDLFQ